MKHSSAFPCPAPLRRAAGALATMATLLLLGGCAATTPGQPPGGAAPAPLHHATLGDEHPGPVVVLQSGLGDDHSPWNDVARTLAAQQRIWLYDRPGYGRSPATDAARDPCSVAMELHAALADAGMRAPYVLVGHSLGGLYQYVYARLYPQEVAALVLLDPTHPRHWATMQQELPTEAAVLRTLRATLFSAAARREFDAQAQCLERLPGAPALGMPVRVLVSTRFSDLEGDGFQHMLWRLRKDWVTLTGAPGLSVVPGAGHYLQRDARAQVVEAVREVSRMASERR